VYAGQIIMSEELEQLRQYLETGQLDAAFGLLDEMDEMSRDDKLHKIQSYMHVLLVHLIKQAAERRTTSSWDRSIRNALFWLPRINRRRKAGGWYMSADELQEALNDIYEHALDSAAAEALGGEHTEASLGAMVDREHLLTQACEMIVAAHE
jgi:hypothetical protein